MSTERIPPVNYTGDVCCDCCGSLTDCEKCEDPKTAELMHRLCWITNENPMDESLGGHIHLCYPCEKSGCNFTEPNGEGEKCGDFEYGPGEITIEPPINGDMECDCVVDPEDGSTITACALHPQDGSLKRKAIWSASV